jgi:hypothetical protein
MAPEDKRPLAWFNGLNKKITIARRLDGRINNLNLFTDFKREVNGEDQIARMSVPEWADHPDIQLLLMRRDRVIELRRDICTAVQIAEHREADLDQRMAAMQSVARLRAMEAEELDAMSKKLDTLRAESNKHWQLVSKLLADLAKLRQNDQQFQDRLKLARDKDAMKGLTADELEVIANAETVKDELADE